jgi:Flp pilus assembly protein TadG
MILVDHISSYKLAMRSRRMAGRFSADDSGTTVIEFAAVVLPFLMLLFGTIVLSFFYFNQTSLERGMDETSRLIRTGQAQQNNMTVDQFKTQICQTANSKAAGDTTTDGWIDCTKVEVFVQQQADWAAVTNNLQPCVDPSGAVLSNPAPGGAKIADYAGEASAIVVVTVCYKWDLPSKIPVIPIGNMNDNARMMQAVTAFRSEPFNQN